MRPPHAAEAVLTGGAREPVAGPAAFQERRVGECRIYAVATASSLGGYVAHAAVCWDRREAPASDGWVSLSELLAARSEAFRFDAEQDALRYAFDMGHRSLRRLFGVASALGGDA